LLWSITAGFCAAAEPVGETEESANVDPQVVLPTIYVKGENSDQSLQDTVSSVAVHTGQDLEDAGLAQLSDSFRYTANVNLGSADGEFVIRGMPSDDLLGASTTPLAQIYVDGATLGDKAARIATDSIWDVDQIEILRGAQSTYQGRNALAGAVVITTMDPQFQWDAKGRVRYLTSEYGDNVSSSIAFGGPILDDVLAFRISAELVEREGYTRNVFTGNYVDFKDSHMVRGKLLFEPDPDLSVLFSVEQKQVDFGGGLTDRRTEDGTGFVLPFDITPGTEAERLNYSTSPDDHSLESANYALQADWAVSDRIGVKSTTSYSFAEDFVRLDHRHGINPAYYPNVSFVIQNPFSIPYVPEGRLTFDPSATQREKQAIFTQEFLLDLDVNERFRGQFGLFYASSKEDEYNFDMDRVNGLQGTVYNGLYPTVEAEVRNYLAPLSGTPGFDELVATYTDGISWNAALNYPETGGYYALTSEPLDIKNKAIFFEGDFDLTSKIHLSAGVRYDHELHTTGLTVSGESLGLPDASSLYYLPQLAGFEPFIDQAVVYSNAYFENALQEASTKAEQEYDAILPSASVTYDLDEDQSLGFFVRRGYRSGGSDLNIPRQFVSQFDPEYTWTYELAYRSLWLNNSLRVNANLFYTDWTDQQVIIGLSELPQDELGFNVGSSNLYGFELESNWQMNRYWALDTSLGYTKTEFEQFDVALANAVIRAQNQQPPANLASDLSFLSGLEFQYAPNWNGSARLSYVSDKGWFGFLGMTYEGSSFTNNGNSVYPGYLNNDERLLVDLNAGYRFDNWSIALTGQNLTDEEYVRSGGFYSVELGTPRTIGLQIQAAF
tara:strand:- start:18417 stop:20924 length:2508 start_codon:yes stop_codon:yes gene_type:complete